MPDLTVHVEFVLSEEEQKAICKATGSELVTKTCCKKWLTGAALRALAHEVDLMGGVKPQKGERK